MRKIVLNLWFISYIAFVATILVVSDARGESDSLYFTSATDLMRQVGSIVGVCDTVRYISQAKADSLRVQGLDFWNPTFITCRRLIDVEILYNFVIDTVDVPYPDWIWEKHREELLPKIRIRPGQAVVWWEAVAK